MPWPDDPCATCPLAAKNSPGPCRAQATRHRRYCDLANPEHPDHKPAYRRMLAGEPEPPREPIPPPPPLPSIARQAVNLATAVAAHVATGAKAATNAERERRLAICRGCELLRDDGRCAACGCATAVKAAWDEQRCPLGRW